MSGKPIYSTLLRRLLMAAGPGLLALIGGYYWLSSGRFVTTDNAYVKADKVLISSEVAGRVVAVQVLDHQRVEAGDLLFRIDPRPYRIALEDARAHLVSTRFEIESYRADYRATEAELHGARDRLQFLRREDQRKKALLKKKLASPSLVDAAHNAYLTSRQQVHALEQKLARIRATLGGNPDILVAQHSRYEEARSRVDQAELDLANTQVRAPIDGTLSRVELQPGAYLKKGTVAFAIVATRAHWIEANLKETQATWVRAGQPVKVWIDAYPGRVWRGRVRSVSPATGAEFAVLPPQNATGNWVKVVQRIPFRIRIEADSAAPPLIAGMSADIRIDTGPGHTAIPGFSELFGHGD